MRHCPPATPEQKVKDDAYSRLQFVSMLHCLHATSGKGRKMIQLVAMEHCLLVNDVASGLVHTNWSEVRFVLLI